LRASGRTASRALSAFKGAVSLLNAEVKFIDTGVSSAVGTAGSVTLLSGITQGDGVSSRDGQSVKLKGGAIRLVSTMHASATRTQTRVLIVVDTRNQGSSPAVTDVLTAATVQSQLNLAAQPGRFVVLYDRVFSQISVGDSSTLFTIIELEALVDMHQLYSGTAAANTSGPTVFLVRLSTEATNTPTQAFESRLLFLDN